MKKDFSQSLPKATPISELINRLNQADKPLSARLLRRLSDLPAADQRELRKAWGELDRDTKLNLVKRLIRLAERDTLVSFVEVGHIALSDLEMDVRALAFPLLADDVSLHTRKMIFNAAKSDPSELVRSAAIAALGQYVYLGELEKIPPAEHKAIESFLFSLLANPENPESSRIRALESVGYSSNSLVNLHITEALRNRNNDWVRSALIAISRSADEKWADTVLEYIEDSNSLLQLEAIRAAGELELARARKRIVELLLSDELDDNLFRAAVTALSQIGGGNALKTLEKLQKTHTTPMEVQLLEEAIENLEMSEGFAPLGIMRLDDMEADEWEEDDIAEDLLESEDWDDIADIAVNEESESNDADDID